MRWHGIKAVLTDIEGTTSSLSFVHDVLFPYARAALPQFVFDRRSDPEVVEILTAARVEAGMPHADDAAIVAQLRAWIDADKKITPLKALQGLIWARGYAKGELRGHVYADAAAALRAWRARELKLAVYSSGSVLAQRLLFAHTDYGDLTPLFSAFFDTTTGPKREPASYRKIADVLATPPAAILFLSDIEAELDAARAAGMHTQWLVRGPTPAANATHPQVESFSEILFNGT